MTARSPSAFLLSTATHGLVVALALAFVWLSRTNPAEQPKILTMVPMVAGAGDNYTATVAPALGTPNGVKFDPPQPVARPVEPVRASAPTPPTPKPVSPVVKPVPASKPAVPLTTMIEKVIDKKVAAAKTQIKKDQVAADKAMTKAQFDAQNAGKNSPAPKAPGPIKPTHIDSNGIATGVVGGSTANKLGGANGTALSREEASQLDAYQSFLVERLRQAHSKPDGLSDLLQTKVSFHISAEGILSGISILVSSGSRDFDNSVIAAFRKVGSIGPTPTGKAYDWTTTFQMRDQP